MTQIYRIKYRNKMFGYNAFFTLKKKFKSKEDAKRWIEKNKTSYIDKLKIFKEKNI